MLHYQLWINLESNARLAVKDMCGENICKVLSLGIGRVDTTDVSQESLEPVCIGGW